MKLKDRILALVQAAAATQSQFMGGGYDFGLLNNKTRELERELDAIDKEAGQGCVVGRALSFGVADGSANYIITKVRKNDVAVAFIPLMDGYQFSGVYDNGKGELCLPRPVAEQQCRMSSTLKAMFS